MYIYNGGHTMSLRAGTYYQKGTTTASGLHWVNANYYQITIEDTVLPWETHRQTGTHEADWYPYSGVLVVFFSEIKQFNRSSVTIELFSFSIPNELNTDDLYSRYHPTVKPILSKLFAVRKPRPVFCELRVGLATCNMVLVHSIHTS